VGGLAIFLRPALGVGLIPALAAWVLMERLAVWGQTKMAVRRQSGGITSSRWGLSPGKWHLSGFRLPGLSGIRLLGLGLTLVLSLIALIRYGPALSSRVLAVLSSKQAAFQTLTGGSRIALPLLEPTGSSFIHVFPTALFNGLFQPVPGSGGQAIYGLFSAELFFVWLLVAIGLLARLFRKGSSYHPITLASSRYFPIPDPSAPAPASEANPSIPASTGPAIPHPAPPNNFIPPSTAPTALDRSPIIKPSAPTGPSRPLPTAPARSLPHPLTTFCLTLAILGLLLIGYIVPFVGAIIRYRSIYLPFLLFPFLHQLQYYRIPARWNQWLTSHIFKK
jgi:hypothetical protein